MERATQLSVHQLQSQKSAELTIAIYVNIRRRCVGVQCYSVAYEAADNELEQPSYVITSVTLAKSRPTWVLARSKLALIPSQM